MKILPTLIIHALTDSHATLMQSSVQSQYGTAANAAIRPKRTATPLINRTVQRNNSTKQTTEMTIKI